MRLDFRWNAWNIEHLARHAIDPEEAQAVVAGARPPFPLSRSDDKWLVWGRGCGGRMVQVVFVLDDDGTVYVIHARPLTVREKYRYRRSLAR
jgi:uncharacterized DUF497 family protein